MKLITITVWTFVNLILFGTCGYLYLMWSKYRASTHQTDLLPSLHSETKSNEAMEEFIGKFKAHEESVKVRKFRRSAFLPHGMHRKVKPTAVANNTAIIIKSNGSPRFPNTNTPVLEFDNGKYSCNDSASTRCAELTSAFGELVEKEFHRVLMEDGKVFNSGLKKHNIYDVRYDGEYGRRRSREGTLCALADLRVRTVTALDEPFARLGFAIPPEPLQPYRTYNTCAVVSSSGALLGSKLGRFIDSHDMVLRFNNAPTANFTADVGSKTTFRVLNSQVVTKPKFRFLEDPLYDNISILIWDPANFDGDLEDWYKHPDFPLFQVYKEFLELKPDADVHLLFPQSLWKIWAVLQEASPYRIKKNPPSSGFIGMWFATQRCAYVRMFEYVPSTRVTNRCHYYSDHRDRDCTLGSWHPLAQEKILANRLRNNPDFEVFQRGFINIPGDVALHCPT